jgi:hypothetical protein
VVAVAETRILSLRERTQVRVSFVISTDGMRSTINH